MTESQCISEFTNAVEYLFNHWTLAILMLGIFMGLFLHPWLFMLFHSIHRKTFKQ